MKQALTAISLVVREYDEAIAFFTGSLRFDLVEDTPMGGGKRWVVLAPPGSAGCRLLLARAKNDEEKAAIGRQAGGRVFLFLHTDDFDRDYRFMRERGVRFVGEPRNEPYGKVVVFMDLYGNKWDFIMAPDSPGAGV